MRQLGNRDRLDVVEPQLVGDGRRLVEGPPSLEQLHRARASPTRSVHASLENIDVLRIEGDLLPVKVRLVGATLIWLHPASLAFRGTTAKRVASTPSAYAAAGSRST